MATKRKTKTTKRKPPIIDLTTKTERLQVRVDGAVYSIVNPEELNALSKRILGKQFGRLGALLSADNPTPESEAEVSEILEAVTSRVLDAPEDVRKGLTDGARLQVVNVFAGVFQTKAQ